MIKSISYILRAALGYVLALLFMCFLLYSIYFSLFFLYKLSGSLANLFSNNPIIVSYISSLLTLFILYVFSREKTDQLLGKLVKQLKNFGKRFSLFPGNGMCFMLRALQCIPKRTLIYSFYLLILIYNQTRSLVPEVSVFCDIIPTDIKTFFQTNEYTIVLLIAFDRISANFHREKELSRKNVVSLGSEIIAQNQRNTPASD